MRRIEIGNVEDRDIIISKNHSQPFSIVLPKKKTKPKLRFSIFLSTIALYDYEYEV